MLFYYFKVVDFFLLQDIQLLIAPVPRSFYTTAAPASGSLMAHPTIPGWSWPLDFSHGVGLLPLPVEPCASRLGRCESGPPASHVALRSLARISDGRKES